MEQGLIYEICGWVACIGMILGYLPQAIETIRTRNTDGIALPTFLMMAVGGFAQQLYLFRITLMESPAIHDAA